MKHRSIFLVVAATGALSSAATALAGAEVGSWYVAPQAVHVDPDDAFKADGATGGSLAFGKVLSEAWDAEVAYTDTRHDVAGGGSKLKLDGPSLNFNRVFLRDKNVNPFLGFGINAMHVRANGTGKYERDFGAAIQAGVLADITSNGALQLSATVGKRFDDFDSKLDDVFAGLGLRLNFGATHKVAAAPVAAAPVAPPPMPVAPPPPMDSDHDGVIDADDRCPNTVAGAKVDATGCELDSDHDGVVDRLDKCPTTPAGDKVDAVGCSLRMGLQVEFDTNSSNIKPDSYAEMDRFVKFLNDVPSANGVMEGHTDNVGKDAYNLKLSQRRADAVKAYVVAKGVDGTRIQTKGFGEARPIADNKTVEGRAANRRVVFDRADGKQ